MGEPGDQGRPGGERGQQGIQGQTGKAAVEIPDCRHAGSDNNTNCNIVNCSIPLYGYSGKAIHPDSGIIMLTRAGCATVGGTVGGQSDDTPP